MRKETKPKKNILSDKVSHLGALILRNAFEKGQDITIPSLGIVIKGKKPKQAGDDDS